jgi:mono/diheme cytochrome c family protein/glucose/arabinose dehydrogenase
MGKRGDRVTSLRVQRIGFWALVIGSGVVSLTVGAQTPPVASQTPPPTAAQQPTPAQPPAAGQQPPAGDPAGRGNRGGGRGTPMWEPDFSPKSPVLPLSPADQAKRFWLPPGFKLEPVLTDPDIEEPAQIAFDGNGRMFVLELRGYMQDADGGGTLDPIGRISVHEDRNNDGVFETHHVFVDKMIFPRFVMPFGANAVLAKESNADELWKYTDTNNDSVADKKELFATGMGRMMNVEHQESGLFWALDNWIYSTINPVRLRWTPTGVLRESIGSPGGQWGATQDNYGKVWFQAGASGMPGYFQFPISYGNFTNPEQFEPDLNITWGAPVLIADMQGGMQAVRMPDGSLARATGSAGNDVFRGDRLPKDMIGDYFYGEVVARIVRRLHPVQSEGLTQLRNVYPFSEFIRSTDPLFRPVDMTTAPDGTMYITDMYRGIIQESQWSGPGTYLRQRIDQYKLDKVVKKGRIWRLSYEGMPRRTTQPRMLNETPAQLAAHLNDPNGWWRDTAQQLLILKQDKSAVPALKQMVQSSSNQLARIHALWTLEGLGEVDAALVRNLMKHADPQTRMQAIRVSETLYKAGEKSLAADYKALAKDSDTNVVIQALLTMNTLKVADGQATIKATNEGNTAKGVQLVTKVMLAPPTTGGRGNMMEGIAPYTAEETASIEKGREIYTQVCFACHGDDGRGHREGNGPALAPPLAASPRVIGHPDYVIRTVLHGLTGQLNDTTYPDVMIGMGQNNDEWVAAIGSYIRNAFGNRAALISAAQVARNRAATADRKTPWNVNELLASLPKQLVIDTTWKASASHNSGIASYALTIQPWSSGQPQQAGMWFQLELPQPTQLTQMQFESPGVVADAGPVVPGAPPRTAIGANANAPSGFPRAYQVQVSSDGTTWSTVAEGKGTGQSLDIWFTPVRAKFIRITQTDSPAGAPPWSIRRLRLFEPGSSTSASR